MKHIFKTLFVVLFVTSFVACSDDDDTTFPPATTTIAEFVAGNPDYSSLLAALEKAELVATLSGEGNFTVFAPNNAAFDAFLTANNLTLDAATKEQLEPILLNHVLGDALTSAQLTTGYRDNLANFSTYVNNSDSGVVINGSANVTTPNLNQTNGIIHAVDAVIALPTVATFAVADPNFSQLALSLTTRTPDVDYAATLSGTESSPFTVFAPTNDAFLDLAARFGIAANTITNTAVGSITPEQLAIVLNYHVIPGTRLLAAGIPDLVEGEAPATLQGERYSGIFIEDNEAVIEDETGVDATIIATDVKATNGVIHAIDKVLLPAAALADDVLDRSITARAVATPGLDLLTAALYRTELNDVLDRPAADGNAYTVFAPTDDAFRTLLDGRDLEDIPVEDLTQILLNHVIVDSDAISASMFVTQGSRYRTTLATYGDTDNNLSIFINIDGGVILNGVATVTGPDVDARNGIVHVVDEVITLPDVTTFATADPNFSTLAQQLTNADLVTALQATNGTGTPEAPFTIFAPTNAAFDNLSSVPTGNELRAVLTYHVIAQSNVRSTDLASVAGEVATVNGANVTISADPATVQGVGNMTASAIVQADVQATNGVIHAIDQVLSPTAMQQP
ncbi:fasciclin domain-containing protein [Aquimarina sp. U1-2]|uniref:fasciclin domain-containing protein n=1 Tax=Aquimarina sp. U1-2 TaxID=2823141 RepID=UPI001AED0F8F|nr:fasciclin domain-containing protein [Aquimarina sp. U1-2]MBP2830903.1 fasciclin domain-containing protein [Aquimarina sp. U1-2]